MPLLRLGDGMVCFGQRGEVDDLGVGMAKLRVQGEEESEQGQSVEKHVVIYSPPRACRAR